MEVAEKVDKVKKNSTEERDNLERIFSFLREKIPGPKGSNIDIRPLWGKFYRVNYWGEDKIKVENKLKDEASMYRIIESKFVQVEIVKDGFILTDHDKK